MVCFLLYLFWIANRSEETTLKLFMFVKQFLKYLTLWAKTLHFTNLFCQDGVSVYFIETGTTFQFPWRTNKETWAINNIHPFQKIKYLAQIDLCYPTNLMFVTIFICKISNITIYPSHTYIVYPSPTVAFGRTIISRHLPLASSC